MSDWDEPDDPSSSVFARRSRPRVRPRRVPPPPPESTRQDPAQPGQGQSQGQGQGQGYGGTQEYSAAPTRPQPDYDHGGQPGYGQPTPGYGNQPTYPQPAPRGPSTRQMPTPGPPEPGYGQPPNRRAAPPRRQDEDRPRRESRGGGLPFGAGTLVGVVGFGCFLAALLVLPWFEAGGEDVTLSDIRSAFTVPETQPEDILPDDGEPAPPAADGQVPSPDAVQDAVEDAARDAAAEAAAQVIDTGKARYLELYVDRLWPIAAVGVGLAVLFSTILSPKSFALSLLLGFRRLSGMVVVLAGIAHGAALWIMFTGTGAPDPSPGVWVGVVGLGAVLVGCILGPKH
ncbi:MAG TPA: hypothetical protein VK611_02815 [Acidimicrobiales bacterium]|nr:hypothetical protein [Acidimicrobiales bacterium]